MYGGDGGGGYGGLSSQAVGIKEEKVPIYFTFSIDLYSFIIQKRFSFNDCGYGEGYDGGYGRGYGGGWMYKGGEYGGNMKKGGYGGYGNNGRGRGGYYGVTAEKYDVCYDCDCDSFVVLSVILI